MEAAPHPWPALGVLLLRDGLVSKEELEEILDEQHDMRQQRVSGRRLGEILIRRGRITPTQIARLVAEQYELPFLDFDVADVDLRAAAQLPEDDARRLSALPVSRREDGTYLLAIADPSTVLFSEELRTLLGSVPRFAVVGPDAMERAIDHVYAQPLEPYASPGAESADALILDFPTGGPVIVPIDEATDGPVARPRPLLGELLVRDGFLTDLELGAALAQQRLAPSYRIGEILVEKGVVSRNVVARLVAEQYELPFVDLDAVDLVPAVAALLDEDVARRLTAVPIDLHEDGSVVVAIADPTYAVYSDELQRTISRPLSFVVAAPDAVEAVLRRVHGSIDRSDPVVPLVPGAPAEEFLLDPSADLELHHELDDLERPQPEPEQHEEVPKPDLEPTLEALGWVHRLELVDELAAFEENPSELEEGPEPAHGWPLETDDGSAPIVSATDVLSEEPPVLQAVSSAPDLIDDHDERLSEDALSFPGLPELLGWADELDDGQDRSSPPEPKEEETPDPGEPIEVEPVLVALHAVSDDEPSSVQADVGAAIEGEGEDEDESSGSDLAIEGEILHLSTRPDGELLVRARVDGGVRTLGTVSTAEGDELVAGLAADGARVHTVATRNGRKTTVFLARPEDPPSLDALGEGDALAELPAFLERAHGAVLVTGPARSGVTTTLYAALERAATPERIAVSLEESVERVLDWVDQVEIDMERGETFAAALRRLRFTDPDVLLVGDLPDRPTAELALQAAGGKSLVIAGLRATSAVDALRRLADLGVESHLVATSLSCVVSQRLLRTICPECRETYYASDDELVSLREGLDAGPRLLARGRGCTACESSGFQGRTAVFEVLPVDAEIRELLAGGVSAKKVRRAAERAGRRALRDEAARLCLEGKTTVGELERALGR